MEFKDIVKKLWDNESSRAFIKLMIYILILGGGILILSFTSKFNRVPVEPITTEEEEEEPALNFEEMRKQLLVGNYEYNFQIDVNGYMVVYNGTVKDNINTGYKENSYGILKYSIRDGIIYKINMDNEEIITDLYDGVDVNFVNIESLISYTEQLPYQTLEDEGCYQYTVATDVSETIIKMFYKDNQINYIEISGSDFLYKLEFRKI